MSIDIEKDGIFHKCAMQAGLIALFEGNFNDSKYVRNMTYEFYEEDLKNRNTQTNIRNT